MRAQAFEQLLCALARVVVELRLADLPARLVQQGRGVPALANVDSACTFVSPFRYGDCGPAFQMSEALQTWLNIIARPRDRVNLRRLQIKP